MWREFRAAQDGPRWRRILTCCASSGHRAAVAGARWRVYCQASDGIGLFPVFSCPAPLGPGASELFDLVEFAPRVRLPFMAAPTLRAASPDIRSRLFRTAAPRAAWPSWTTRPRPGVTQQSASSRGTTGFPGTSTHRPTDLQTHKPTDPQTHRPTDPQSPAGPSFHLTEHPPWCIVMERRCLGPLGRRTRRDPARRQPDRFPPYRKLQGTGVSTG
jgi:hypothetical protein